MNKIIITVAFLFIAHIGLGQKLIVNGVDKFTKNYVKETSLEVIAMPFINALRFRMKSIDGTKYVIFKLSIHDVFSIREGDPVFLLLANDNSIELRCNKGTIAEKLSGSGNLWYGEGWYSITDDQMEKISASPIVAIRIDTGDSYVSFDKVKDKNYKKFIKAYSLIKD